MERRHIETFIKVSEKRSFSKAAAELGYSQAAITIQIQQLEASLKVQLIDRFNKNIRLTQAGKQFLPHAYQIAREFEAAENFREGPLKGTLRIGTVDSLATAIFPDLLYEFHQKFPQVEVIIEMGKTTTLIEKLHHNDLDMIYTLDDKVYDPSMKKVLSEAEEIIFVTAQKDLAKQQDIALHDLMTYPFILTEKNASYRYELEKQLADLAIDLKAVVEVGNTDIIVNLLQRGIGVSFLPRFAVQDKLKSGQLYALDVEHKAVFMWGQVIYHRQKYLTEAMASFIDLLENHYQKSHLEACL